MSDPISIDAVRARVSATPHASPVLKEFLLGALATSTPDEAPLLWQPWLDLLPNTRKHPHTEEQRALEILHWLYAEYTPLVLEGIAPDTLLARFREAPPFGWLEDWFTHKPHVLELESALDEAPPDWPEPPHWPAAYDWTPLDLFSLHAFERWYTAAERAANASGFPPSELCWVFTDESGTLQGIGRHAALWFAQRAAESIPFQPREDANEDEHVEDYVAQLTPRIEAEMAARAAALHASAFALVSRLAALTK